jgi:subtilisin family serine protease
MAKKSRVRPIRAAASKRGKRNQRPSDPVEPSPSGTAPASVTVPPHSAAASTASNRGRRIELSRGAALPSMLDPERRESWGFNKDETKPDPYMIELNLRYPGGLRAAAKAFRELLAAVVEDPDAVTVKVTSAYYRCDLTVAQWSKLIELDEAWETQRKSTQTRGKQRWVRCIYRVWPDFIVKPLMDSSVATVKADAALRSFSASGRNITWAIIDSGVQADHLHFGPPDDDKHHRLLNSDVRDLHRDFTIDLGTGVDDDIDEPAAPPQTSAAAALADEFGHGTHVAGIISGQAPLTAANEVVAFERVFVATSDTDHQVALKQRSCDATEMRGVAPECNIVSLKVLNGDGAGRTSNVIRALAYIRNHVNRNPKLMRIHGVNLSLGYEFDAEMFACGQSPLCAEVDRLVQSGVVVVAAAGNTGWGIATSAARVTRVGFSASINDPGNAARAITVGATHRESPHTYGVSFFSSKGPTGDGRLKPDLVAPGERITSCAAGKKLASLPLKKTKRGKRRAAYLDDSGTSMAAPHVSGAVAAFLSIRREFIGRPDDIKRIFLESATPLGRERYFEGHGLVDLMRAIQSV